MRDTVWDEQQASALLAEIEDIGLADGRRVLAQIV